MTPAQIDKKYMAFRIVYTSNVDGLVEVVKERANEFRGVKMRALRGLEQVLERHYGRGDHTVVIYGMNYVNVTTPERRRLGFDDWDWVQGEEVFRL